MDGNDENNSVRVLFVAGVGRSGSTLLDRLLNEVDGYCALGEAARFVWRRGLKENQLCGSGQPFRESSFWQDVFDEAFGGMETVEPETILEMQRAVSRRRHLSQYVLNLYTPSLKRALPSYLEKMDRLYRGIHKVSGVDVLGDISKRPLEAYLLSRLPSVSVSVLHLVRDARAVAHSWQRKKERTEITGETVYMPRLNPSETARWWIGRNSLTHAFRMKGFPYLRIHYEDLVQTPKEVLEEIADFMQLDGDLPHFGPNNEVKLGDNNTISGNPMRFKRGEIRIRVDAAWKREMAPLAKWKVTLFALPLLLGYGYGLES